MNLAKNVADAQAKCAAAEKNAERVYGITDRDLSSFILRDLGEGWLERLSLTERDPPFPISAGFKCPDGTRKALLRVTSSVWIQYPERFARTIRWWGGLPSAPESGRPNKWMPDDLYVITDSTTQGELRAFPPGTLARDKDGGFVRIGD
jgi:hypothetical protein